MNTPESLDEWLANLEQEYADGIPSDPTKVVVELAVALKFEISRLAEECAAQTYYIDEKVCALAKALRPLAPIEGVFDDIPTLAECRERLRQGTHGVLDGALDTFKGCDVPPRGWVCSRDKGHEGPCAARESR